MSRVVETRIRPVPMKGTTRACSHPFLKMDTVCTPFAFEK
jgi:hypothetical protein